MFDSYIKSDNVPWHVAVLRALTDSQIEVNIDEIANIISAAKYRSDAQTGVGRTHIKSSLNALIKVGKVYCMTTYDKYGATDRQGEYLDKPRENPWREALFYAVTHMGGTATSDEVVEYLYATHKRSFHDVKNPQHMVLSAARANADMFDLDGNIISARHTRAEKKEEKYTNKVAANEVTAELIEYLSNAKRPQHITDVISFIREHSTEDLTLTQARKILQDIPIKTVWGEYYTTDSCLLPIAGVEQSRFEELFTPDRLKHAILQVLYNYDVPLNAEVIKVLLSNHGLWDVESAREVLNQLYVLEASILVQSPLDTLDNRFSITDTGLVYLIDMLQENTVVPEHRTAENIESILVDAASAVRLANGLEPQNTKPSYSHLKAATGYKWERTEDFDVVSTVTGKTDPYVLKGAGFVIYYLDEDIIAMTRLDDLSQIMNYRETEWNAVSWIKDLGSDAADFGLASAQLLLGSVAYTHQYIIS